MKTAATPHGCIQPPSAATSQLVLDLVEVVSTNVANEITVNCDHAPDRAACHSCIRAMVRKVIAASNDIALPEN